MPAAIAGAEAVREKIMAGGEIGRWDFRCTVQAEECQEEGSSCIPLVVANVSCGRSSELIRERSLRDVTWVQKRPC